MWRLPIVFCSLGVACRPPQRRLSKIDCDAGERTRRRGVCVDVQQGGEAIELKRQLLTAQTIDPGTGEEIRTPIEVRFDPLTGHSSRILPERGLMPANDFDLEMFARETQQQCPFCPGRLNKLTPKLPPVVHADRRIAQGEAVLFANLHAYSSHSSVSVYASRLHYLPLEDITERLLADNLATQVTCAKAVTAADAQSRWASINANHRLPSGSSLFRAHLQGIVDLQPTTFQPDSLTTTAHADVGMTRLMPTMTACRAWCETSRKLFASVESGGRPTANRGVAVRFRTSPFAGWGLTGRLHPRPARLLAYPGAGTGGYAFRCARKSGLIPGCR
jgi:hypothetical protein